MSGYSEKESACLSEFRDRLEDVLRPDHDDDYLHKWLKARCYDVKKAEAMYRTSMAFREKMNVDNILCEYDPPKVIKKYLTGGFCGTDKEGSPVRVELFGYLDMKGIMCSCCKSDLEKTKLAQCEYAVRMWQESSRKLGKRVDGLTVIFDMENVGTKSLWKPGLDMYLHLVKVLEDNYPEMMKRMYVINAPSIFPILWSICRPLISEDMNNKIKVLGGHYKEELLKVIDESQLPACYGGTLVGPNDDPRCSHLICQGGTVLREFYQSENIDTEKMNTVTIQQGKELRIAFTIERPGTVLRWEFRTEDYDIGFGIMRLLDDGKEEEIVPIERYKCHQVAEDGSFLCQQTGQYHLVFDNKSSWIRPKNLHYYITLDGFKDGFHTIIND